VFRVQGSWFRIVEAAILANCLCGTRKERGARSGEGCEWKGHFCVATISMLDMATMLETLLGESTRVDSG